ncbi:MAG: hypothetical protein ACREMW_04095 [Gemmatimonadales bacterium]
MRGMGALVHRLELGDRDPGVELGGRELRVAEQRLEVADFSRIRSVEPFGS